MQRRDAIKLMLGAGASVGVAATMSGIVPTKANAANKDITSNIVIMGAGLGGITLAAKLRNEAPNAKITLIDKDETFYYQPGFTLISVGEYTKDDVIFSKADYIPDGAAWIKANVSAINPNANELSLDNGQSIKYDVLVIASGVEYDFEAIKGLSIDDINAPSGNIASIYTLDGAVKTNALMAEFAKNGGSFVTAEQKTAMKCSGANKKVTFMSESRISREGNQDKGNITLYVGGGKLFSDPTYAGVMAAMATKRGIKFNLRHQIVEVDKAANKAVFEFWTPYKENGEAKVAKEYIEAKYDYLHLAPKQKASAIFKEAGLSTSALNFVDVNKKSLQSTKYPNIFAIGDVCNFPMGKTGASIRKMYPRLASNIIAHIKGQSLEEFYDGYTACPFITQYGKAVMVEFNWSGTASSMPCFGATRESSINWLIKLYAFKPMVMRGMLKARA